MTPRTATLYWRTWHCPVTQAGSEKSRYPARGMPPPPSLNRCRPAFRVTGATPSGRPGPRATNSHKRQAGAAPFKADRWAAWRAPAWPNRATQASAPLKPWRAAWRLARRRRGRRDSRLQARGVPGRSSLKRKTPRSRASCRPARARARWRPPLSVAGRTAADGHERCPRPCSSCGARDGTRAGAPKPRRAASGLAPRSARPGRHAG